MNEEPDIDIDLYCPNCFEFFYSKNIPKEYSVDLGEIILLRCPNGCEGNTVCDSIPHTTTKEYINYRYTFLCE